MTPEGWRVVLVELYIHTGTMQLVRAIVQGICIVAFAWYGTGALRSVSMVIEFERYGLARMRVLTGTLQIIGSVGLLAGYVFRPLLVLSASAFAAMMLLAVLVRIRIRDPLLDTIPAFVLLCLNLFLAVSAS